MSTGGAPSSARLRGILIVLGCLLGIAINCYLKLPALPYIVRGDNDFMGFYASARLAGTGDLYNPEALEREESKLWTSHRFLPFVRLPFYAAAIVPLRAFSYEKAYWIWQAASLAALIGAICLWPAPKKWPIVMACCWSAPLLDCFIMGRDVTVVLLTVAASMALFVRGRHFAAGCVLSLCLIKYNLFLPVPLLIASKRLWRFGGGMVVGGGVLLAACFAVGGWRWPWQYAAMLRLPATTPNYDGLPNLHGLFCGQPHPLLLEAVAACMVLAAAWIVIRGQDVARGVAAMLACGLLVSYHAFFGDAVILTPACVYLLGKDSSIAGRLAGISLLCPLAYVPFMMPDPPFPPSAVLLIPLLAMAANEMRMKSYVSVQQRIAGVNGPLI